MAAQRTSISRSLGKEHPSPPQPGPSLDPGALMGAVRDDVRQTLRVAWLDPALEAVATDPRFFTAAWSAVRPNVGRSFLALARRVREEAVGALRGGLVVDGLAERLAGALRIDERHRLDDVARAAHLAAAKFQIVMFAFRRAVMGERVRGTGREEPPIRRGVPDWQRWMAIGTVDDLAAESLSAIATSLGTPSVPGALRLLGRWPVTLAAVGDELLAAAGSDGWGVATTRVRRAVLGGIGTLPHPVQVQWPALRNRGFTDQDRKAVSEAVLAHDSAMATHTLVAAFLWLALGAPDIGLEP